ncbi:MAG: hypothetical protein ACT4QF_10645 [Sporichthyaceae bacterium]|jgi:hypothetical protein
MTFYYDLASHAWAVEEQESAPARSWLPAAAGVVVLLGSTAAAGILWLLGA